ncbi:MAG: hypothetical protein FJ319_13550 [SAR202 cluster bacterium]|nr:hypothetical protein [SAR202 cluster bacterium]
MSTNENDAPEQAGKKRTRVVRPYPLNTLQDSLGIARAIWEKNAGRPFDRVLLAKAVNTTPASSGFTFRVNSSAKYGLTIGGYADEKISLTRRGEAIMAPMSQEERHAALLEAAMEPDAFGKFYRLLNGKKVPEDQYAQNMLQAELGVPAALTQECLALIKENGLFAGILGQVGGGLYVSVSGAHGRQDLAARPPASAAGTAGHAEGVTTADQARPTDKPQAMPEAGPAAIQAGSAQGKIFVAHGGGGNVVEYVESVLQALGAAYELHEINLENPAPVSQQATRAMRGASAAILVTGQAAGIRMQQKLMYLMGAAAMLFGDRVVSVEAKELVPEYEDGQLDRTIRFRPDDGHEVALPLVRELVRCGAIKVWVVPLNIDQG